MSKLDKEKVLAEYTEAYKKAHGKAPKIESSNGWYSVDGGKNVRLAALAEEAKSLSAGGNAKTEKSAAKKSTATKDTAASKKAPAKKPAAKTATVKKSSGGLTAKELWKQKLESDASACRLPRGKF